MRGQGVRRSDPLRDGDTVFFSHIDIEEEKVKGLADLDRGKELFAVVKTSDIDGGMVRGMESVLKAYMR